MSTRKARQRAPKRVAFLAAIAMAIAALPAIADETVAASTAPIDDRALENAIERRLARIATVDDSDIDVFVSDGMVKVSGSVATMAERNRVMDMARSFRGVRGVTDELHVLKSDRDDAAIKSDVAWTISQDPYLRGSDVQVSVQNGEVTLTGKVDTWAKKKLAYDLAQGISGVTEIANNIQLSYAAPSSDTDIQKAIAQNFRTTRLLADDTITIHVNKGQVELHGTVDSAGEADYATRLAWVPGVTTVDSDLAVSMKEAAPKREIAALSDAELKSIIEHRLEEQPFLGIDDVDVEVSGGVVTLEGVVPSIRTKEAAIREARLTNGVVRIHDRLQIRGAPVVASDLHDALHRDFESSASLADDEISIKVEDTGAVYLSGEVDSIDERQRAVDIASRYAGVSEIINNLDVANARAMTDAELADAVKDELYWSALVDSDDINVSVENGVVTLTGTVEDLTEFEALIDNAYQAGARDVVARLQLEDGGMIKDDIRVQAKYSYKKE